MIEVWHNDGDQVLAYRRKNLIFVFNFNPTKSFTDYGFLVPVGAYDVVLNTDATAFGGNVWLMTVYVISLISTLFIRRIKRNG